MDATQFLAEFGHFVEAQGGIRKLRELILQLAISGRLTERVAGDVAAPELIEANRNIRESLVAQKVLKRQTEPSPVTTRDQPWMLPEGWAWTRLGSVTNYGKAPKVEFDDVQEDTWVLELEDIEKGTSRLLSKVPAHARRFKSTKNYFPAGSVLYGKLRPYLDKVLIAESPGVCTTEIMPISFFENIDAGYLRWFLKSPYFITYANGSTHGMNLPRLGTVAAREALFAFPPQKEQSRIVAKVDELMALCDKLESQQQVRGKLQTNLRQATLQAVANAASPQELQTTWSRLAENFGLLYQVPKDVRQLRDVLHYLTLRGILLPDTMLPKGGDAAGAEFAPLPGGWEWTTLANLSEYITSGSRGWKAYMANHGDSFIRSQDIKHDALIFESPAFVNLPDNVEGTRTLVRASDLLLTITGGNVGRCATVPELSNRAYVSQHVALIRLREPGLSEFIHFWMINNFGGQAFLGRYIYGDKPGLNLSQVGSIPIPLPPLELLPEILEYLRRYQQICNRLSEQLLDKQAVATSLASASVSALTGMAIGQEEDEPLRAPQTELIAPLRLGEAPDIKAQAPLAAILARHNGTMVAKDLWQRFGGGIDGFYTQLKTEVTHGWILEPEPGEMREKQNDTVSA